MKIGHGWTKTTESGAKCITIALDEIIGVIFPVFNLLLECCFITLWYIPKEERKSENSPNWAVTLSVKKDKKQQSEPSKDINEDELPF